MGHQARQFAVAFASVFAGTVLSAVTAANGSIILTTPSAGDATYAWNSKYGPYGYGTGEQSLGVGLSMGGQYGNDRTVTIFEVPISALAGQTLTSATLQVDSLGFGTGYYYGSAVIGWLDTGTAVLTGDVVADALGPASGAVPSHWVIYDSGAADITGIRTFDATSLVQSDLDAGRSYSTFVMSGSRDTYGSIRSAESGAGPRIIATVVPEPTSAGLFLIAGALAGMRRVRRRQE